MAENILKEAILKTQGESYWRELIEKAQANPAFSRYADQIIKEGITSDIAGALGRMHDVVVEAAKPALIGREIISVMETKEALVRFPKAIKAKAYQTAELSEYWVTGEKYTTTDVTCDIEIKAGAEWSKKFLEDASWRVMEREAAEIGRAIAELETTRILNLYKNIASGSLAGGAEISTNEGSSFAWSDVVSLWNAVRRANWAPDVLVVNEREMAGVLSQNQFIQSLYYAPEKAIRQGVFDLPVLGMKIVSSTLVPSVDATHNYKFAIDTSVAAVLLIRRDITTEPFENPKADTYGVVASERIGLGVLRADAVARGV